MPSRIARELSSLTRPRRSKVRVSFGRAATHCLYVLQPLPAFGGGLETTTTLSTRYLPPQARGRRLEALFVRGRDIAPESDASPQ